MVTQTPVQRKLIANALKGYALKLLFSSLDLIGNQLLLQKGWRCNDPPYFKAAYGPHDKNHINIFRPPGELTQRLPVLIYFHGGGFLVGDKNGYNAICRTLSDYGYVTFNVNYRLAPKYRYIAQTQDVANAIAWIHRNATDYGGDRQSIILAGDSAGALHASWYASALERIDLFKHVGVKHTIPRSTLKGLLLFYGIYDFTNVTETGFPFINTFVYNFLAENPEQPFADAACLLSPIRHVTHTLPPTFLCVGEKDSLYQQTKQYSRALKNAGVKTTAFYLSESLYPDASHGFLYFANRQCTKRAFREAARFLGEVTLINRSKI